MPAALAGKDITARASTGSGKTLAYLLPALQRILSQPQPQQRAGWQALVLVPTRELCEQVGCEKRPAVWQHAPALSTAHVTGQAGSDPCMHAHTASGAVGSLQLGMHAMQIQNGCRMDMNAACYDLSRCLQCCKR